MAYALQSLVQILERDQLRHHLSSATRSEIDSFLEKARSLRDLVEDTSFKINEDLGSRIRDFAHEAEDAIESHIVDRLCNPVSVENIMEELTLDQLPVPNKENDEFELTDVMKKFGAINEQIVMLKMLRSEKVVHELSQCVAKPKGHIWGFNRDISQLKNPLRSEQKSQLLQVIPIVSIGGNGKIKLATFLYNDSSIISHVDIRAWATISQEFNLRLILLELLDCLINVTYETRSENDDQQLGEYLNATLFNKRYLVVLDNIWNTNALDELQKFFPDNNNGSRIILTARECNLAEDARNSFYPHQILPINDVCNCPPELVEIGFKIARNCRGHPLTIVTMSGFLSTSGKTLDAWQRIESKLKANVREEVSSGDLNLDVLSMSYNTLPYHLKPCFLYVGVFPKDYEIETKRIIHMWIAEGFVRPIAESSLEVTGSMYLESLISRNLLFACGRDLNGRATSFKIHEELWKFCWKKALDEKFLQFKDLNCQNNIEDGVNVRRVRVHPKCLPKNNEDKDMSFARSFSALVLLH